MHVIYKALPKLCIRFFETEDLIDLNELSLSVGDDSSDPAEPCNDVDLECGTHFPLRYEGAV